MNNQHALISKLQKKRLMVKTKKRGFHKGTRQSSKFGSSLEFSDFRAYQPGDDVRQIDWNVYGRTQKHYIKRYLDEQELSIAIYLDATSSMRKINKKWELAKYIGAALSFIVLNSEDRLFFTSVSSMGVQPVKRKGAVYSRRTFLEILQLDEAERTGDFIKNLNQSIVKKQQLSIIITDGLEPLNEIENLLKKLAAYKQEVWFIQVLSAEEISPQFSGDMKLIDVETDSIVNVSMSPSILAEYEKRILEHNRNLKAICRKFGGQYLLASDNRDIQSILFHDFSGKGLIN
ncbi:DUF58 domain-containing protein [Bacillus sp. DTU_2020_1000418_1_SI_GHA_SEK_038]|uniref:DUF58 domain-containing protein n=1 Tax=Bacillus sp. DTU_2020_1000418_1_SI_GHA_SEK_038 TaxID=3077585 RepID=UPI0028E76FA2|nr:DUF58 domain-containing protein [Bacillus sp. DTU_2020_1000418_1_SI_GHA_SEK_038]WNS77144.1 DUF58 domain-containing protein [Bacillus sp. DTU_2020_1000418_1_SI_GHA_SEK_038]